MNIAILVKEFPPDIIGGTETQTRRMATELERDGHEITVYTKSYDRNSNIDTNFELVRVPNWRITPFVSTLTFVILSTLYLLRDRKKFDVAQCMMVYPNGFVGYVVSKLTGIPYFAWIRGGDYYFMKDALIKRWLIKTVLHDTLVLTQTEGISDDVRKEFPNAKSLEVLGNGVDIPEQTADGDEIVFVGRLKQQKGVDVLLKAVQDIEASLLIVGDGPEREEFELLAKKLDVDATFVGWVEPNKVTESLLQGQIFVLPSIEGEGMPNVILEAFAVGLPVVATDTGGIADLVNNEETGFVVPPNDTESLNDAIAKLYHEDAMREEMGNTARKYVEDNYRWDIFVERLTSIYSRVIEEDYLDLS